MWPYWYVSAKYQSQTFLLSSLFLAGNPCLDYCDSDPLSLYMSLEIFLNSVTLWPCALGRVLCYTKALCNIGCRHQRWATYQGREFLLPLLHLGFHWRTSSTSMLLALRQWYSVNNGKWPSGTHTRPLWGETHRSRNRYGFPSCTTFEASLWNLAGPRVRLGERNPDSGCEAFTLHDQGNTRSEARYKSNVY